MSSILHIGVNARSFLAGTARALAVVMLVCAVPLCGPMYGQSTWGANPTWVPSGTKVGIGISNPNSALAVAGQAAIGSGNSTQTWGFDLYVNGNQPNMLIDAYGLNSPAALFIQGRNAANNGVNHRLAVDGNGLLSIIPGNLGSTAFAINQSGNVGIGTATPGALLDVLNSQNAFTNLQITNANAGTGSQVGVGAVSDASIIELRAHALARTVTRYGVPLGGYSELLARGGNGLLIGTFTDAKPIILGTNGLERMRIDSSGSVGIGTSNPQSKLAVNGTITTREVVVTNTGWSDYVFRPDYRLQPLNEVEAYIKEHHHLPEIRSEAEVKEKGVGVGEMQSKLLAKIEELTLHMIHADERNNRLEQQNRELQERIARLEKPTVTAAVK